MKKINLSCNPMTIMLTDEMMINVLFDSHLS